MAAEKKDLLLFLVVWAFTATFFLVQTSSNMSLFLVTITFVAIAAISLLVLLNLKSDDVYYQNMAPKSLILAICGAVGMVAISMVMSSWIGSENLLATTAFTPAVILPSSVVTNFLYDALFTFAMVATAEELLKIAGYAEIKSRKFQFANILAVLVPVGLWAIYHGLQSYSNPLMVIPAFFNGLLLIGLLEYTKSFLAPIITHGIYNSVVIFLQYWSANINLPWFPTSLVYTDIVLFALAAVWIAFVLVPIVQRRNAQ